MAVPVIVVKAIATAATDKRTWKLISVLLAAVCVPIILVVMMLLVMFTQTEQANKSLLDYSFQNAEIPVSFTSEQVSAIENMRGWLAKLDAVMAESEDSSLDENMVRAVFYSLQFGTPLPTDEDRNEVEFDYNRFCECFEGVTAEQIDVAWENVSESFLQYEVTDNIRSMARKVYEYLHGNS